MLIAKDLYLNMMRIGEIFFDQQTFVAEGVQSFAFCKLDGFL